MISDLGQHAGAVDVAHGELATTIAISPSTPFKVEDIDALKLPSSVADSVDQQIDRALKQR
jgi:hypothetical protein